MYKSNCHFNAVGWFVFELFNTGSTRVYCLTRCWFKFLQKRSCFWDKLLPKQNHFVQTHRGVVLSLLSCCCIKKFAHHEWSTWDGACRFQSSHLFNEWYWFALRFKQKISQKPETVVSKEIILFKSRELWKKATSCKPARSPMCIKSEFHWKLINRFQLILPILWFNVLFVWFPFQCF